MRVIIFLGFLPVLVYAFNPSFVQAGTTECIPLVETGYSNRNSKIDVRKAGKYCLLSDLHARFDFADHPAEGRQIHIWTSNVEIDLRGHTIGRGRFFMQRGDIGIELDTSSKNIKIKNGTIENFEVGIYRTGYKSHKKQVILKPVEKDNVFLFEEDQVTFENIIFKNCDQNFLIRGWVDDFDQHEKNP